MQAFWTQAMQLPGIDTGPADSNKRMLVIFDPDCPVCARQWRVLQPYLDRVRIHWVPVAYINGASLHRAAAILSAADPASALARNEQGFDFRRQQGGLAIPSDISAQALDTVRANTRTLMRDAGVIATPTLGFELYPHKRYYRMLGMLDAAGMKRAVDTLGHTMDPWHAESTTAEQHSP
ncbi:thioredoxin fold domain-containing protein [Oleiagrimonas soli]|uniref:Protein-disulfide isomerase n=1 Tax=Oleiagrimonas soli TaxID=1543381 RepID=A0A841KKT4_9GAMM|nr:thioredoxin fold domain-containing protein [Oleiagrimonas soli]MBB6184547.1 protein-disulfide isomerase [Oleiagrimonas soli]